MVRMNARRNARRAMEAHRNILYISATHKQI